MDETEIIHQVRSGSTDAYELLVQKYESQVFRFVSTRVPYHDVEGVAHDSFVRAYNSLEKLSRSDSFGAWLMSICARSIQDYWRNQYRQRKWSFVQLCKTDDESESMELMDVAILRHEKRKNQEELSRFIDDFMGRLSHEDRAVMLLIHLEKRSVKEVAELLGWSESKVKVRSHRARAKLKSLMDTSE